MGFEAKFSLRKDAKNLERLLRKEVIFLGNLDFKSIRRRINQVSKGSISILENLRFWRGEVKNDAVFSKKLASLGDFYVNDAFAVSHRANASVAAITKFLPAYGGLELEKEVNNLSRVMKSPQNPLVVVLGGAKIEDKLGVIKYFRNKADTFLIGGAPANILLALRGIDVGTSAIEIEKEADEEIRRLADDKKIILPSDFRRGDSAILDIGSKSERAFAKKISEARTVVWNGPMGVFEKKSFRHGTYAVAKAIAGNKNAFSVVGGGETVTAVRQMKLHKQFNFVSTGGGAMLEFLAGRKLPGIEALKR